MTIDQFRERMATDEPIVGGSDLHMVFHKYSQEALRITAPAIHNTIALPIPNAGYIYCYFLTSLGLTPNWFLT